MRSWLPLLLCMCACGARPAQSTTLPVAKDDPDARAQGGKEITLEPLRIEVVENEDGTLGTTATDARSLFEEGNDALLQRRFDDAVAAYDKLAENFPGSQLVPAALYNAGIALEEKQDYLGAAERYRRSLALAPARSGDAKDASFRLGAALAEVNHFGESELVFADLLEWDTLTPADRLEALSRLGYALVEQKDYVGAEEVLRSALDFYRQTEAQEHLESNYYASMAQYQLAVIAHRQFRAVPLRYPEEQMGKDLDQKSELFLLAQDRYWKVVDLYPNPYWTTASIYQMGSMFEEFWVDFMAVPLPPGMSEAGAKEYVKLINENPQLRVLLEKSLFFHESNVVGSKKNGIQTVWVDASARRAVGVKALINRQQQGELFMPGKSPTETDPLGAEGREPKVPGGGPGEGPEQGDYIPTRTNL